ncbi:TetR/AcrR family transcriptional regulator [Propionimicrobium sp. PCR01-08-3]|uniref:TetR/AcrR family transcriptional regulator n=1 Tax=Propionimicrobium sp. PCR01-08-3 TaxID=3052086 RepID=UPI00255C9149|nr:TetR/AcrR family transcriptional regulator [Propionimicrobium sp. PCR01-08-3]WIY82162.1 TetR family transcriptional regulator [Propionimicrobium sp. PCR01-08-3]
MPGTPAEEPVVWSPNEAGDESTCGLREQKKRQTRRDLHHAALVLVQKEGLDAATVDRIAAAAGVSPRTFFNYFPTKEAAILGLPPNVGERMKAQLEARPADEDPWESITLIARGLFSRQLDDYQLRQEIINRYPQLVHSVRTVTQDARATVRVVLADQLRAQGMDADEAARRGIVYADLAMTFLTSAIRITQLGSTNLDDAFAEVQQIVRGLDLGGPAE